MKASDNPFPSILLGEGAAPAAPAAGNQRLFIDSVDHKLKRVSSTGAVASIGPRVKWLRYSSALRISATTTFSPLTDSVGGAIGTALDLTLPAGAGDTIEVGANFGYANEAEDPYISFASVVGATVTNIFAAAGKMAIPGLWGTGGVYTNASGSAFYVVQAADLSSGALTVRPLGRTSAGSSVRSILGGNGNTSIWWLKNWGPQ